MADDNKEITIAAEDVHRTTASRILFLLILLSIIINIIPFHSRLSGFPAMLRLADAGIIGYEIIMNKRGLYLALEEKLPGARIILPEKSPLDIAQFYGLGRVGHIEQANYDPETLHAGFDLSPHIVKGFQAKRQSMPGSFAIALDSDNPQALIILKRNGIWFLVDTSLLPFDTYQAVN